MEARQQPKEVKISTEETSKKGQLLWDNLNDEAKVETLLKENVDPDYKVTTSWGLSQWKDWTPLAYAVHKQKKNLVQLLIDAGADVSQMYPGTQKPLINQVLEKKLWEIACLFFEKKMTLPKTIENVSLRHWILGGSLTEEGPYMIDSFYNHKEYVRSMQAEDCVKKRILSSITTREDLQQEKPIEYMGHQWSLHVRAVLKDLCCVSNILLQMGADPDEVIPNCFLYSANTWYPLSILEVYFLRVGFAYYDYSDPIPIKIQVTHSSKESYSDLPSRFYNFKVYLDHTLKLAEKSKYKSVVELNEEKLFKLSSKKFVDEFMKVFNKRITCIKQASQIVTESAGISQGLVDGSTSHEECKRVGVFR